MRVPKFAACLLLCLLIAAGCGPKEDEHDHSHDHGSHAPHGGHLITLDSPDYSAEWTHDDAKGKLTIFILDKAGKKDVAIATDVVKITGKKKMGGSEEPVGFEYSLLAVNASSDDPPKASRFENSKSNPNLLTDAKLGEAVSATLEFEVDGKKYQGKIEHDHHDH